MILAELEVFHSRPIAPTRRVALGRARPAGRRRRPGFGGHPARRHRRGAHPGARPRAVRRPRPAHPPARGGLPDPPAPAAAPPADRPGGPAAQRPPAAWATGEELAFELDDKGSAAQHILAAVYAAGALPPGAREPGDGGDPQGHALDGRDRRHARGPPVRAGPAPWLVGARRTATRSAGRCGCSTCGAGATVPAAGPSSAGSATWSAAAHPDHGGDRGEAADRIAELAEARRILLCDRDDRRRRPALPRARAAAGTTRRWSRSTRALVDTLACRWCGPTSPTAARAGAAPDRAPKLIACVREEARRLSTTAGVAPDAAGAGGPLDGRPHVLDGGGRGPARRRAGADRLPAAPAGPARPPADRALPRHHGPVPVRVRHPGPVRHARGVGVATPPPSPAR